YIYVADYGNSRIIKWTTNYSMGGICVVSCTGTVGVAANQLDAPRDLKFDAAGNLNLKPAQQRVLAALDEFVVESVKAWSCLSNIVNGMPVPQVYRKRLLKQIDLAEQYQKVIHSGHCSDNSDCITHCTTFGLSDPKCPEHEAKCTQAHTSDCPDCINISRTLDEIGEMIKQISNEEFKRETKYDFDNASQHIIEWSRHNIRGARQNEAKNQIISQIGDDEAFCTFDWGQNILPQEFRGKQSTYFGKKGMSVLVGSFVWKNSSTITATTTSPSTPTFYTESYILAITNAAQKDLDSLSANEIIIKQFKENRMHIKNLHKHTDNAGVSVPYKNIDFSTNMRLTSPFTVPINEEDHAIASKKRSDREHHHFFMCLLSGCTSTFESSTDLDSHISANLHKVPPPNPRTSNDIARLHLIEAVRSINTQTHRATDRVRKHQDVIDGDMSNSIHAEHFSSAGRALRTRKHNNTMSEKTINCIQDIWLNSLKTGSKLTPDQVQHQIRTQRDDRSGQTLF
ncbi:unnamed protein product, partial [Rotaria magnacalcarata]